jgi:DNA-directed RNA polymerase subunit RPC12/RpoP
MPDQISVSFKCKKCGTNLSWPDNISDSTEVVCSGCGAKAGPYRELKKTATDAAKKKIESMVSDIFKRH